MALDIGTLAGFLDLDTGPWDDALDGAEGKMGGLSKGALAVGALAGGLLAKGFTDSMNIEAANDKLAAQLGLTGEEAAKYGDIAGSLYADAYGGSIEEVNDAIDAVSSSLGRFVGTSDEALQGATAKAMDLAATFGIDVADAAATAGQALQHGLARDADEAFDLITVSMQKMPATLRDELIPMIDEYAVHLQAMGFEGEDAFGLLVNASQDGTFAIDKTADAIKEVAIRATDGSETTASAFEAIGLDADTMAGRVVEGGSSARAALDDIINGLLAMPDPAARAQAAVGLFGTPLEDMSVTQIPEFLRGLRDSADVMGDTEGAADDLGTVLNDNLGIKLESVKRKAELFLVDFLESPFGPWVAGGVVLATGLVALVGPMKTVVSNVQALRSGLSTAVSSMGGLGNAAKLAGGAAGLGALAFGLKAWSDAEAESKAVERLDALTESLARSGAEADRAAEFQAKVAIALNGTQGAFEDVLETAPELAEEFIRIAESAGLNEEEVNEMRARLDEARDATVGGREASEEYEASLDEQATAAGGVAAAHEDAVKALQEYADGLSASFDPMFAMIDASNKVRDARSSVTEAETALNEAIATHGVNSMEAMAAQQALTDAQVGAVESAVDMEQAETALAEKVADGSVKVSEMKDRLNEWVASGTITATEADLMRERIRLYSEQVRAHPATARTEVSAPGAETARQQVVDAAVALFGLPPSRTVDVDVNVNVRERVVGAARSLFSSFLGREAGGPVRAGEAYIVGEERPELFIPDQSGMIVPEVPSFLHGAAAGAAVGGGGATVQVTIAGTGGGDRFLDWLRDSVRVEGGGDVQVALGR